MPKTLRKSQRCLNCGYYVGNSNYCAHCGQLNTNKQVSLRYFFHDFLGDYFTFDSKFFRSFIPLIGKPGHLTTEYNQGKRSRYILPLRLYIFTTFLFFLVITLNNKIQDLTDADSAKSEMVANQDSLESFLEVYSSSSDSVANARLAHDLYSHFDLTYLQSENDDSLFKILKNTIRQAPAKPDSELADKLAQDLFLNFEFSKKFDENSISDVTSLDNNVFFYSDQLNEDTRNWIVNKLDSTYEIDRVKRKRNAANIKIFNSDPDSSDSKFGSFIESKIQKIVTRGEEGKTQFLSQMVDQIPKVLFLLLPIFALLMKLFYIRHKIFYINHLVFSLHLHTIFFIYILIPIFFSNGYIILITLIFLWFHIFMAFRNVYGQSFVKTFFKMNLVMFIYTFFLIFGVLLIVFFAIISV